MIKWDVFLLLLLIFNTVDIFSARKGGCCKNGCCGGKCSGKRNNKTSTSTEDDRKRSGFKQPNKSKSNINSNPNSNPLMDNSNYQQNTNNTNEMTNQQNMNNNNPLMNNNNPMMNMNNQKNQMMNNQMNMNNNPMMNMNNQMNNNNPLMNNNNPMMNMNNQKNQMINNQMNQTNNNYINNNNMNNNNMNNNQMMNNQGVVDKTITIKQIKYKTTDIGKIELDGEEKLKVQICEQVKLYKNPTLIGLDNIGATCFMNASLQCLSQTEQLTNFFLNQNNTDKIINNNIAKVNKNGDQLSLAFRNLILRLWDKTFNVKSISPNEFRILVEKMNPLFKQGQAGDSKDFIIFILERIQTEISKPVNYKQNINNAMNQYDKNNAFSYFFNEFTDKVSIITDLFFGFTETTNECLNCKNNYNSKGLNNPICYNYGLFNCLIFPLEEVKNMKNNYNQMNLNNIVSIYECFYYNQKSDYFTGENKNYCNICNQLFDSIYTSKIYVAPNVLILILNRGKGNIHHVKLDFYEKIDISQYVLRKDNPKMIYNLYGVITHIGESGPNAHFVASCKSPVDNKWYRYNDSIVHLIKNFQNEVIDFGTPYILFYQKQN